MKEQVKQALDMKTKILSSADIERIVMTVGLDVIMDRLIVDMYEAFANYDPQKTIIPIRSGFNYTQPEPGLIEWMPLYEKAKQIVVKMVGYHPNSPNKYNLPTILSTISSYDTTTGHLKTIMDGVFPTALRTGAASAIATRIFANPHSKILGLVGCGAQSVTQLHALSRIYDFDRILYYDIDGDAHASFPKRVAILGLDAQFQEADIDTICQQSDIICTATSIGVGEGPLFHDLPQKKHLHINAVGSDFPGKVELPLAFLQQAFVCPDFTEQAIKEGECQQLASSEIGDDLFQCAKQPKQYEKLKDTWTVFDSTGTPLEDLVVMEMFLAYAADMELGLDIEIENTLPDTKNPYHFMKMEKAMPALAKNK